MTTNIDLMRIRADTAYTYDHRGRMLKTNEPVPEYRRPAPQVFLGVVGEGCVIRVGAQVPDPLASSLDAVSDSSDPVEAIRSRLVSHGREAKEAGGPAFRFPDAIDVPPEVVRLTPENREILRSTFPWLHDEIDYWQPTLGFVRGGAAVSVCFSSRIGPIALDAGVVTLADYRGRGYATAVTAAWAAAVRASGRIPLYSTSWDNAASRAVARRLGLVMFGSDTTWT